MKSTQTGTVKPYDQREPYSAAICSGPGVGYYRAGQKGKGP
jgi:hypothetical protein